MPWSGSRRLVSKRSKGKVKSEVYYKKQLAPAFCNPQGSLGTLLFPCWNPWGSLLLQEATGTFFWNHLGFPSCLESLDSHRSVFGIPVYRSLGPQPIPACGSQDLLQPPPPGTGLQLGRSPSTTKRECGKACEDPSRDPWGSGNLERESEGP